MDFSGTVYQLGLMDFGVMVHLGSVYFIKIKNFFIIESKVDKGKS